MANFIFSTFFLLLFVLGIRFIFQKNDFIKFLAIGLDSGFKLKEIIVLYQAASFTDLPDPCALYISVPALNSCITHIIADSQNDNTINSIKIQRLLEKLYKFRTEIELDPKNANGMKTTKSIRPGQKLRIVLSGFGVFSSKVVNSGRELCISLPMQKNSVMLTGSEWVGRTLRVYLNRPGDAGYVFNSNVVKSGAFNGSTVLMLEHTEELFRSQKRKSVRCACNIIAQLYIPNSDSMNYLGIETSPGLKCLLEDISDTGALIRIGGKGQKNAKIKIQFLLGEEIIVMFGLVRAVEYNATTNQSRLHFEALGLPQKTKNIILSYVYNVMPQDEKDEFDAINLAEQDTEDETETDESENLLDQENILNEQKNALLQQEKSLLEQQKQISEIAVEPKIETEKPKSEPAEIKAEEVLDYIDVI